MIMKNPIILACAALFAAACTKTAEIKVTNRVGSCMISNMTFGEYNIPGSMITNESSEVKEIKAGKRDFPKKHPLKFYMTKGPNKVVLRTREEFELKQGQTLEIAIENDTEVLTP